MDLYERLMFAALSTILAIFLRKAREEIKFHNLYPSCLLEKLSTVFLREFGVSSTDDNHRNINLSSIKTTALYLCDPEVTA